MEKASQNLTDFIKANAWGILVAFVIVITNYALLSFRIDASEKILIDHEARLRVIEMRQERISEKLNSIDEKIEYIKKAVEK